MADILGIAETPPDIFLMQKVLLFIIIPFLIFFCILWLLCKKEKFQKDFKIIPALITVTAVVLAVAAFLFLSGLWSPSILILPIFGAIESIIILKIIYKENWKRTIKFGLVFWICGLIIFMLSLLLISYAITMLFQKFFPVPTGLVAQ